MKNLRSILILIIGLAMLASACAVPTGAAATNTSPPTSIAIGAPPIEPPIAPPPDGTVPPATDPPPVEQDPAIDQMLRSFNAWDAPIFASTDDRELGTKSFQTGGFNVTCSVAQTREFLPGPFDEFAAFVFSGDILPGLIVDGQGVLEGDLRPVPVDRAPLTLQMNLASANPNAVVPDPTSNALNQAVADLKADADARLTGIDIVPAQVDFLLEETSSYEEAMLQMGISLRYDGPSFSGKFESQFNQSSNATTHSVTMRLLQPMFTVSVDRSKIASPGDLVSNAAQVGDLNALVNDGHMGPENPPVLIDSITYGRSVYFTVTSSEVENASDLRVAVEGAYGGFSGDAEVSTQHRSIVQNSSIKANAYGGDQDIALDALRNGEIKGFLQAVNTSNAAPLTLTMRTLDGAKIAVTDEATIQDIGCNRSAIIEPPTDFKIRLDSGSATMTMKINGVEINEYDWNTHRTLTISSYLREDSINTVSILVWPSTCFANPNAIVAFIVDGVEVRSDRKLDPRCHWESTWTIDEGAKTVSAPDFWPSS